MAKLFNDWLNTQNHLETVTKNKLYSNLDKWKDLMNFLKNNSKKKPDIDGFMLKIVY